MGGSVIIAQRKNGVCKFLDAHTSQIGLINDVNYLMQNGAGELNNLFMKAQESPPFPAGYGLVFVDFDTKWAGSLQGYTHVFAEIGASFPLSSFGGPDKFKRLRGLIKKGWVKRYNFYNESEDKMDYANLNLHKNFWESLEGFNEDKLNPHLKSPLSNILVEPPGWTIEHFEENSKALFTFAIKLYHLNIDLSEVVHYWHNFNRSYDAYAYEEPESIIDFSKEFNLYVQKDKASKLKKKIDDKTARLSLSKNSAKKPNKFI